MASFFKKLFRGLGWLLAALAICVVAVLLWALAQFGYDYAVNAYENAHRQALSASDRRFRCSFDDFADFVVSRGEEVGLNRVRGLPGVDEIGAGEGNNGNYPAAVVVSETLGGVRLTFIEAPPGGASILTIYPRTTFFGGGPRVFAADYSRHMLGVLTRTSGRCVSLRSN